MVSYRWYLVLFIVCFVRDDALVAAAVGSNIAVSQQALTSFPTTDVTNQALGFAAFVNGFTLLGGGSCVFNSFYPVGGTVTLNGGILSLSKDLVFQKGISFYNGGTILGNNKTITFLDTDGLQLPSTIAATNNFPFITQVNTGASILSCDWSYDATNLAVVNAAVNYFKVYDFTGSAIVATGASPAASSSYLCIAWHPSRQYIAAGRKQSKSINNIELWQYDSVLNTFNALSNSTQNKDISSLAWDPSGTYLAVGTASGGTGIVLYALENDQLNFVDEYTLSPSRSISANALSWSPDGKYIVIGTAKTSARYGYEVMVFTITENVLELNAFADLNSAVSSVAYSPTDNVIAIGLTSGSDRFQLYSHNQQEGTLTQLTTENVVIPTSVLSLSWSPDGNYLALGAAKSSSINELYIYVFDRASQSLSLGTSFNSNGNVNTVAWAKDGEYLAVGDSANYLSIYGNSNTLIFNNAKLIFNSDVTFTIPTIFQGACSIDGNNNEINFGNSGSIQLASGASVTFKNLTINNCTAATLYCTDSTGIINFDAMQLYLGAGDFTLANGTFTVSNLVTITGQYAFNYQSNQASTILANATLYIDEGVTLNYAPSVSANNLIKFSDATSILRLNSATLKVSNAGLQLTQGRIEMDGKCYIVNNGTQASQGLLLGDGSSAANNVTVRILPEAQCIVSSGYVVDKSV